MYADDVPFAKCTLTTRFYKNPHIGENRIGITSDERRQITSRTGLFKALRNINHLLNRKTGGIEINAAVSVYLKIYPFSFHCCSQLLRESRIARKYPIDSGIQSVSPCLPNALASSRPRQPS